MDKPGEQTTIEKREGDITIRTTVEKLENGFLVSVSKSGKKGEAPEAGVEDKREWFSEESKAFSKTNPLKPETEEVEDEKSAKDILKSFVKFESDTDGTMDID